MSQTLCGKGEINMQLLEDGVPLVPPAGQTYRLRLYVAGQTPKSVLAFRNLKQICEEHLHGHYEIEIIDLLQNPQLAQGDQIQLVKPIDPDVLGRLLSEGTESS